MQDALGEVIGYAHDKMGLQQIEAWTLTTNARAHRVLDRLGAVSETRPDSLAPDGRRADHLRWVLMFAP
jgi:RimJ/RimL family protein N-acetyltransferase